MNTQKNHVYNLVSEDKNSIWKFVVNDPDLKIKNGDVKDKVISFADIVVKEKNEEWDLIIHKDMVAFKLPTERITYIYSKRYWDSRCDKNLINLKILKK
ncbi:hypothetical protein [Clostridium butyricum]